MMGENPRKCRQIIGDKIISNSSNCNITYVPSRKPITAQDKQFGRKISAMPKYLKTKPQFSDYHFFLKKKVK